MKPRNQIDFGVTVRYSGQRNLEPREHSVWHTHETPSTRPMLLHDPASQAAS